MTHVELSLFVSYVVTAELLKGLACHVLNMRAGRELRPKTEFKN